MALFHMQGNGGRIGSMNVFVVSLLHCRQLFADMSTTGLPSAYSTSTTQVQHNPSEYKYRRTRRSTSSRRQQYKTPSYFAWITHVTIRQPRHIVLACTKVLPPTSPNPASPRVRYHQMIHINQSHRLTSAQGRSRYINCSLRIMHNTRLST